MLKNQEDLSIEEQEELTKRGNLNTQDFSKIYKVYNERIFNFIYSRVKNRQDAEDLTSLVFERVLKKLADFQWQGVTITSWIYKIARNAIIDFYRKNSERKYDSSIEEVGDFLASNDEKLDKVLIDSEEEIKLYNTLRGLAEDEQFLIYYKFFEDLSNKEIADITGLSESNVGTKLHRLRSKIKQVLEKWEKGK